MGVREATVWEYIGVPKMLGILLGVPKMRIIVFWGSTLRSPYL